MNSPAIKNLLEVKNLHKSFNEDRLFFAKTSPSALNNINFTLAPHQTLAIVGKNGVGKSILAKILVGLIPYTSGNIYFKNQKLTYGDYKFRSRHLRMIFQDPNAMFNPRLTMRQTLEMPLKLLTDLNTEQRFSKIIETLNLVGFYPEQADTLLNTISIAQKQCLALAFALIINPEIIIIDDALTNLDTTLKIKMINLLLKIQKQLGTSYIYIGQNLGIIKHIADKIIVMDDGKIIEQAPIKEFFMDPATDLGKRLVESEFGKLLTPESWA